MDKRLKGLIFIFVGFILIFPHFLSKALIKFLIAMFFILMGIVLLLDKNG